MNNLEHLERLLNTRFDAVDQRFDGLDREMRDVKVDVREVKRQTTITNGRVNGHDATIAGMTERVTAIRTDVDALKERPVPGDTSALEERAMALLQKAETGAERPVRVWLVLAIISAIVSTYAVMSALGMVKKPSEVVTPAPQAVIR